MTQNFMPPVGVYVPDAVKVWILEPVIPPPPPVWNVGTAPAPLLVSTCPAVPTLAMLCSGPVVVVPPQSTAYAVALPSPVPPRATAAVPVQPKVSVCVAIVPVKLGRDYGDAVEIVAGLNGQEQVILNPPDSLNAGATAPPDSPGIRGMGA